MRGSATRGLAAMIVAAGFLSASPSHAQFSGAPLLHRDLIPGSVRVGRLARHFYLYKPDSAQLPAPLLLVLHGGGPATEALGISRRTRFKAIADREGFVIAYPSGIANNWNDGRQSESDREIAVDRIDDVGFFRRLIDALVEDGIARRTQVYVTGLSNGGMMSFRLACDLNDRIAAAAPMIANMPTTLIKSCVPGRAVPLLVMNGTEDPLIPWQGGPVAPQFPPDRGIVVSTDESLGFWRKNNRCAEPAVQTHLPDRDADDGTRVVRHRWQNCAGETELQLYEIVGGGHTLPGWRMAKFPFLARILGRSSQDIDAEEIIWAFLKRFKLPE